MTNNLERQTAPPFFGNLQERIHNQYERWPYPKIPLIGSVRRTDTWQINLSYLKDRCGFGPPPPRPHILIVGCGTFQPYVFALANPNANILATDISQESLRRARYRNLLHGFWNVKYQTIDLNNPTTYPEGPFDYIECYGVLMNLESPEQALKQLALRLTPEGIIRIMVYPHFSRGRIVQIQRLAKLLGLHFQENAHPGLLRKIIHLLPHEHPLRYAFTTYQDSQNDAGIVDGFLHAGDRRFTGDQLGDLVSQAGLQPAFYFHRPWGQPAKMAKSLNLPDWNDFLILHYLDLWQELRTNFIVCLIKQNPSPTDVSQDRKPHPLLQSNTGPVLHRLKIGIHSIVGITLPSRTETDPIKISSKELRNLSKPYKIEEDIKERLSQLGILLGARPRSIYKEWFSHGAVSPLSSIAIGQVAPNPFYESLFSAYTFEHEGLVPLTEQIKRWQIQADPLEEEGEFGLTPFGTYLRFSEEILDYVARYPMCETVLTFDQVRFREERLEQVVSFLKQFPSLPRSSWNEAELREFWILLFSYSYLFLESSQRTG